MKRNTYSVWYLDSDGTKIYVARFATKEKAIIVREAIEEIIEHVRSFATCQDKIEIRGEA